MALEMTEDAIQFCRYFGCPNCRKLLYSQHQDYFWDNLQFHCVTSMALTCLMLYGNTPPYKFNISPDPQAETPRGAAGCSIFCHWDGYVTMYVYDIYIYMIYIHSYKGSCFLYTKAYGHTHTHNLALFPFNATSFLSDPSR